jgi:hypothetical protein
MSSKLESLKKQKQELIEGLPHLYGPKWYKWAWEFYVSQNKMNLLTAANQISKSSTLIRKNIDWATDQTKWPKLWLMRPTNFWYLYPSKDIATVEYEEKWVKEFLPRGKYKDDPYYGWTHDVRDKKIYAIKFNSGVTIYFRTYEQGGYLLQTSSPYMVSCDEELPAELYGELAARLFATNGYFNHVFTATLCQEMWRLAMEEKGEHEIFKTAFKKQVSMYQCIKYMDGTPSQWTEERIEEIKHQCGTDDEIQRRVYGRFVVSKDRMYPGFSRKKNFIQGHKLPASWPVYSGVDVGGGEGSHPGAICFIAVNQEFTKGRVFYGWRGDNEVTTAGDIFLKYLEICGDKHIKPVLQTYDYGSKDFGTIADRARIPFIKADKSRDSGEKLLNTLFKTGMLCIHNDCPELNKLVIELENLKRSTPKPQAKDDFIDSLRYAAMMIPWDFSFLLSPEKVDTKEETIKDERMRHYKGLDREPVNEDSTEKEFFEANEYYEGVLEDASEAWEGETEGSIG